MKTLLTLVAVCVLYTVEAQSVKRSPERSPEQSIIYDAIQLYHASNGVTFYFRHIDRPKNGITNIEIIDLYNQQRVGKLSEFTPDNITDTNQKIVWFLRRFNARKTPLSPGDWIDAEKDTAKEAYDGAAVKVKSQAIIAALKARYPANEFNHSANSIFDKALQENSGLFKWSKASPDMVAQFFKDYTTGEVTLKNISTDVGGGLAQNLGEGLADFLIERANEELRAAVFRRLIKAFEDNPELPILFPAIYEFLQNVEQYNFDLAIKTIQARAEKDLNNLLANIPKLSALDKYKILINKNPGVVYVLAAMTTLDGLQHKLDPVGIIDSVYLAPYADLQNDHANALKFAGYISQSFRNVLKVGTPGDQNKNWILLNNIWYGVTGTKTITENYLQLLVLRDPGIGFQWSADGKPGIIPFEKLNEKLPSLQAKSSNLLQMVIALNKIIDSRNSLAGDKPAVVFAAPGAKPATELLKRPEVLTLLDNIFAITENGLALIPDEVLPNKAQILALVNKAQDALPILDRVLDIADQVKLKNYNEVIFSAGLLVKELLDQHGEFIPEEYFQYGNFLASVAIAKNGADVKAAIDAVALPSGSSSIKKDLVFNAALNGYVGYFARSLDEDERYYDGFTETHGITAPVGITISHGMGKRGSLSLFLGVLDVGAIVKYKVSENPDETPSPTIEWGNILSPSAHLVYGAPAYLPISFGIGGQWLPKQMEDDKLKFNGGFNIFLAFDIPIINLASSKKRSTYAINAKKSAGGKNKKTP